MSGKDEETQNISLRTMPFHIRGKGTLRFFDDCNELRELTGKIIVGREPGDTIVLAQVTIGENVFLMPISSVSKIIWGRKS